MPLSLGRVAKHAVLLALTPLIEFILLRLYVSRVLDVHLGYAYGNDFDFVPQAAFAVFVLFFVLETGTPIQLRLRKAWAIFHAAMLFSFLFVSFLFAEKISYANRPFIFYWFFHAVSALGSGLFVFLGPEYYWKNPKRVFILPGLLLAGSNLLAKIFFSWLWMYAARATGWVVYVFLNLFVPNLTYDLRQVPREWGVEENSFLSHPSFVAYVGEGCSGLEGIFFLLFAVGILLLLNPRRFGVSHWGLTFLVGIIYMFTLNVLRISSVFLLALAGATILSDYPWVSDFAISLFHSSVGVLLYGLGVALFVRLVFGNQPLPAAK